MHRIAPIPNADLTVSSSRPKDAGILKTSIQISGAFDKACNSRVDARAIR